MWCGMVCGVAWFGVGVWCRCLVSVLMLVLGSLLVGYGVVQYPAVWCGVLWWGGVWCGGVWRGVVWFALLVLAHFRKAGRV